MASRSHTLVIESVREALHQRWCAELYGTAPRSGVTGSKTRQSSGLRPESETDCSGAFGSEMLN